MNEVTNSATELLAPVVFLPKPESKAAIVSKMLKRPRGATLGELGAATKWQAHSVRAFLSGLRKQGHALVREQRKSGEQTYRITAPIKDV